MDRLKKKERKKEKEKFASRKVSPVGSLLRILSPATSVSDTNLSCSPTGKGRK